MRGPFFSATGFTLIELIIVMVLTSVLAMAALPPLTQVLRARAPAQSSGCRRFTPLRNRAYGA